jgi:hypothetical protein
MFSCQEKNLEPSGKERLPFFPIWVKSQRECDIVVWILVIVSGNSRYSYFLAFLLILM